ncbi:unnamed protein product [Amoebophrya sp. A25]|nr:unnamed protein product [Amoebophrya sp. A25]|eukprot:GSA25T00003164001.1
MATSQRVVDADKSDVPLQCNVTGFSGHLSALNGTYFAPTDQKNHDRPLFKKKENQYQQTGTESSCNIYYWDNRDGPDLAGWWCAPVVGGEQVWAHNPHTGDVPPSSGWRVPWHKQEADPNVRMETGTPSELSRRRGNDDASGYGAPNAKRQYQENGGYGIQPQADGQQQMRTFADPTAAINMLTKNVKFLTPSPNYRGTFDWKRQLHYAEESLKQCKAINFTNYAKSVDPKQIEQWEAMIKTKEEEIEARKKEWQEGAAIALKFLEEEFETEANELWTAVEAEAKEFLEKAKAQAYIIKNSKDLKEDEDLAKSLVSEAAEFLADGTTKLQAEFQKLREFLKKNTDFCDAKMMEATAEETVKLASYRPKVDELRTKMTEKWSSITEGLNQFRIAKAHGNSVLAALAVKEEAKKEAVLKEKRDVLLRTADTKILEALFYLEDTFTALQQPPPGSPPKDADPDEMDPTSPAGRRREALLQEAEMQKEAAYRKLAEQANGLIAHIRGSECMKHPCLAVPTPRDPELSKLRVRLQSAYIARVARLLDGISTWNRERALYVAEEKFELDVAIASAVQSYMEGNNLTEAQFFDKMAGNSPEEGKGSRTGLLPEEIVQFLDAEGIVTKDLAERVPVLLQKCLEVRTQSIEKPALPSTDSEAEPVELASAKQSKFAQENEGLILCDDFFLYVGKAVLLCVKEVVLTQSSSNCNLTVPADVVDKEEYIGKIPKDEFLSAIEAPVRIGKVRRVKVRRDRDGVEGYVTMRHQATVDLHPPGGSSAAMKAPELFVCNFDAHFVVMEESPLFDENGSQLGRSLRRHEKVVVLSLQEESNKQKVMSLLDGTVAFITPKTPAGISVLASPGAAGGHARDLVGPLGSSMSDIEADTNLLQDADMHANIADMCKNLVFDLNQVVTKACAPVAKQIEAVCAELETLDKKVQKQANESVVKRLETAPESTTVRTLGAEIEKKLTDMLVELRSHRPKFHKYEADLHLVWTPEAAKAAQANGEVSPTHSPSLSANGKHKASMLEKLRPRFEKLLNTYKEAEKSLLDKRSECATTVQRLAALHSSLTSRKTAEEHQAIVAHWRTETSKHGDVLLAADKAVRVAIQQRISKTTPYKEALSAIEAAEETSNALSQVITDVTAWLDAHQPVVPPAPKEETAPMDVEEGEEDDAEKEPATKKMKKSSAKKADIKEDKGEDAKRAPYGLAEVVALFTNLRIRCTEATTFVATRVASFLRSQKSDLPKKAHFEISRAITSKWKKDHDKHRGELFEKCVKAESNKGLAKEKLASPAAIQQVLKKELKLPLETETVETLCRQFCTVYHGEEEEAHAKEGALSKDDFVKWFSKVYFRVVQPVLLTENLSLAGDKVAKIRELKAGEMLTLRGGDVEETELKGGPVDSNNTSSTTKTLNRVYVETSAGEVGYCSIQGSSGQRAFLSYVASRGFFLKNSTAYPDGTELAFGEIVQLVSVPSLEDGLADVVVLRREYAERKAGRIVVIVPAAMSIVVESNLAKFVSPAPKAVEEPPKPVEEAAPAEANGDVEMKNEEGGDGTIAEEQSSKKASEKKHSEKKKSASPKRAAAE